MTYLNSESSHFFVSFCRDLYRYFDTITKINLYFQKIYFELSLWLSHRVRSFCSGTCFLTSKHTYSSHYLQVIIDKNVILDDILWLCSSNFSSRSYISIIFIVVVEVDNCYYSLRRIVINFHTSWSFDISNEDHIMSSN